MVLRPFLGRHLPFLLGIRAERIEHISPRVVDVEHAVTSVNVPFEYRPKTDAGFGGVNNSAGEIWYQRPAILAPLSPLVPPLRMRRWEARELGI